VDIWQADGDIYAAVVDGTVAVKLGPGSWSPTAASVPVAQGRNGWALVTSGNDFAVRVRVQSVDKQQVQWQWVSRWCSRAADQQRVESCT
jgi:hypothetical protein